jgi:hypothetical protein
MLRVPNRRFWMNPALISQNTSRMAYFSPFGKAHDTVIPSLPRVRGSLLQLHSWTPWTYGILSFSNLRVHFHWENPIRGVHKIVLYKLVY